jgi:DNA-binding MarR family transcriptional regulator
MNQASSAADCAPDATPALSDADYETLAAFRHVLRGFLHFSEGAGHSVGLTPQQHQALLAVRAAPSATLSVGELADRLMLKPHSTTELVNRLVQAGLLRRQSGGEDGRRVLLVLTVHAEARLRALSAAHRDELLRIRPMLTALLDGLDPPEV